MALIRTIHRGSFKIPESAMAFFIAETVLRYGYTTGQAEFITELVKTRSAEDAKRRASNIDQGLAYDQTKHTATNNRYTRKLDDVRNQCLINRFKGLVRSAETLGVCREVAMLFGLWYQETKCFGGAGSLPPGEMQDRRWCMAHIYGPLFTEKSLSRKMITIVSDVLNQVSIGRFVACAREFRPTGVGSPASLVSAQRRRKQDQTCIARLGCPRASRQPSG